MIMMTDPNEHVAAGLLRGSQQRRFTFDDTPQRSNPNHYVSRQPVADTSQQLKPAAGTTKQLKPALSPDDGYCTDSRSNTLSSVSSPLSSSLSSLSMFDSASYNPNSAPFNPNSASFNPNSASFNPNSAPPYNQHISYNSINNQPAMQRGPIEKGPNPIGARSPISKHSGIPAKRRELLLESPDNTSLEDRLRALTTIEEEDSSGPYRDRGFGKNGAMGYTRDSQDYPGSPRDFRYNKRTVENPGFGSALNYATPQSADAGYFRAVPVAVVSNEGSSFFPDRGSDGYHTPSPRGDHVSQKGSQGGAMASPSIHLNGDGWRDYTTFFQKDSEIPLHNIDPAGRGKFTNLCNDDVFDMDINRQIGTGSPAQHKKMSRFNYPETENLGLVHGKNETVLNRGQTRSYSSSSGQFMYSGVEDTGQDRADFQGVENRSSFQHVSRQSQMMSSMPDLRYQDPSWVPGVTQPHAGIRSHYPPHNDQYWSQQPQSHVYERLTQPRYQPSPKPPPQPEPPVHSLTNRYVNQQQMYASSMDVYDSTRQSRGNSQIYPDQQVDGYPEAVLRRSRLTSSARATPTHQDRYSWQPESMYDAPLESEKMRRAERTSLDLGNIPQLQKQIRATSELCLQASRRHMFASSADIYKLFSGQKKPPTPASPTMSCQNGFSGEASRQSLNSTPSNIWPGASHAPASPQYVQESPRPKPKLRIVMPPSSLAGVSSPKPIRADHSIGIPPTTWSSITSLPNSALYETDKPSFQRHTPMSSVIDQERINFQQRPISDRPLFQRQSSGYSSETELQQIEFNAKSARKLQTHQGMSLSLENSNQEFIPLNRSADDSNTGTDQTDEIIDNEPLYVNQSMMSRGRTSDSLNKSSGSDWIDTPKQTDVFLQEEMGQATSDQRPPSASSVVYQNMRSVIPQTAKTNKDNTAYPEITQNQVVKINYRPITITSHVPAHPFSGPEENNNNNNSNYNYDSNFTSNTGNNRNTPPKSYPLTPHISVVHDYPVDQHARDQISNPPYSYPHAAHLHPGNGQLYEPNGHVTRHRSVQLSPVEIAQMLDTPFATNIISDEQGDRLSTLV
ncbi:dual specificity protein kinase splA-like [Physella acuta]|uniref:dual specificity protein kinase splA-like n=1 Tax=Physella acuta TaxID=109671 RepID=UPI0027DC24B0|nr:dual specificity protein kinase splA-like [Physella acuta]